jgi:flavin-dependent dehydrogenase
LLAESDWIRTQAGSLLELQPRARQAVSARLCPVAGDGWLAVGDAASSVDPLAACGILRAMRGGIMAAYAAGQFLVQRTAAGIDRYTALQAAEFSAFLRSRQRFYSQERRWSSQLFWHRRQSEHNVDL